MVKQANRGLNHPFGPVAAIVAAAKDPLSPLTCNPAVGEGCGARAGDLGGGGGGDVGGLLSEW